MDKDIIILNLIIVLIGINILDFIITNRKLVNSFKNVLLRFILSIIFYILRPFPRNKKIVVFGADAGSGFAGNSRYLFLEAQKCKQIRPIWITKNKHIYIQMKQNRYEVYLAKSLKGIWIQLRAKTAIMTNCIKDDFFYLVMAGATSINTWHGVGLKQSWFRNKNAYAGKVMAMPEGPGKAIRMLFLKCNQTKRNYVISTSDAVTEYYPVTFHVPRKNIFNLGQARNDVFFDNSLETGYIPEFYRNNKVITYMPTHRDYGKKQGYAEKEIGMAIDYKKLSELLEKYGYKFVIKQHRWVTHSHVELNYRYNNIIDITYDNYDIDAQMILKYTDILITDYSSCYTDYLLLDRPVLFYCPDLGDYLQKWDLNFDYCDVTPGPKVFNSEDLICELEKIMLKEDDYKEERQRVKDIFYSSENQQPVAAKQMQFILENIIFEQRGNSK